MELQPMGYGQTLIADMHANDRIEHEYADAASVWLESVLTNILLGNFTTIQITHIVYVYLKIALKNWFNLNLFLQISDSLLHRH